MADVEYAAQPGAGEGRGATGGNTLLAVAGATVSLAFMVGIGVWGYKLMARDVSGVPVVHAIEAPMRVQPTDPGGRPADHQGLAVNDVAARGQAAPAPDQLYLAPRPVALTSEDQAMKEFEALKVSSAEDGSASEGLDETDQDGALTALVNELTKGVKPLEGTLPDGEEVLAALTPEAEWPGVTELAPAADTPDDQLPADVDVEEIDDPNADIDKVTAVDAPVIDAPGVRRSLRPLPRPASLSRAIAKPVAAHPVAAAAVAEIDPEALAPGTRLAQLGAFDSVEVARQEWTKLSARFSDYIEGKQRVVQKATSGGRTFYRLRAAGFDDLSDARRFCSALVAEGADCIPVVTR